MILYDPDNHLIKDTVAGTTHPFYHSDVVRELPTEVIVLLKFAAGRLTLQEAYTCLLSSKLDIFKSEVLSIEKVGDIMRIMGAQTIEDFNKLTNQEETQND